MGELTVDKPDETTRELHKPLIKPLLFGEIVELIGHMQHIKHPHPEGSTIHK